MADGLPTYTEALQLDQKGSEEPPAASDKQLHKTLQDLPHDFHEHLPGDPGDHPRDFPHNVSAIQGDQPWDFHEHSLDDSTDLPTRLYQLADEHRARGDLPKDSPLSLKVFPFKLSEPHIPLQRPCTEAVSSLSRSKTPLLTTATSLLKGQKMITIYSTRDEEKDIGSGTRPVIAEFPRKLIGYFSGNFIFDWTNLEIGPCSDSVSTFLIDWMKAG